MSTHNAVLLGSLLVPDFVGFGHPLVRLPESNRENASPTVGSEVFDRSIYSAEERRLRRKISNRESARRSRIRKQRRLEELRLDADRLQDEKRILAGRLGAVRRCCLLFHLENERQVMVSHELRRRLSEIQRAILCRRSPILSVGRDMLLASLIA